MNWTLVILAAYLLDQVIVFYCLAQTDQQLQQIKQSLKQICMDINVQLEKVDNHGVGVDNYAKDAGKLILEQKRLVERQHKLRGLIASYYTWSLILEYVPQLACEVLIAYLMTSTGSDDAIWEQGLYILYLSTTWSKRIVTIILYSEKVTLGLTNTLLVYLRTFLDVATRLASFFLVKLAFFDLSPPAPTKMDTAPGPEVNLVVYGVPAIIMWAIGQVNNMQPFDEYLVKNLPRQKQTRCKNAIRWMLPRWNANSNGFLSYMVLFMLSQCLDDLILFTLVKFQLPRIPETPDWDHFGIPFLVYLALFLAQFFLWKAVSRYDEARYIPDENLKQKTD
jgi:hypothetical protein